MLIGVGKGKAWAALALAALLAACSGGIVPSPQGASRPTRPHGTSQAPSYRPSRPAPYRPARQPVPATPIAPAPVAAGAGPSAVSLGVVAGPPIASLPIDDRQAGLALVAFRASCPSLQARTDGSGLTQPGDWSAACAAAAATDGRDARGFFIRWFQTAQIGDGKAYATGYYVPQIAASLDHRAGYDTPIYGRPSDLIDVDLGQFSVSLKGKHVRGRVDSTNLVPYYDRAAIEQGAITRSAPVLAWAADPIEFFFLQVQGSGQLLLPDGRVVGIGYASQNGRDYTGIGALMRQRGLVGPNDDLSMQGIVAWLRAHPDQGRDIMDTNKSFVFFRMINTDPVGALGVPVAGGASAAVDPHFVPMGAPVFLSMDRTDATALWVAQDTGGAIKGANRFDTFWGAGENAAAIAGGMSARGTAFVLLPAAALARLTGATNARTPAQP